MSRIVTIAVLTTVCSMAVFSTAQAQSGPIVSASDPAVSVYAQKCREGTFTGFGMGYQNCINQGLKREVAARAIGGHDSANLAALPRQ